MYAPAGSISNNISLPRGFDDYWSFAVFGGPYFIVNLPKRLIIMNSSFIAVTTFLFIMFWKYFEQLFDYFNSASFDHHSTNEAPVWQKSRYSLECNKLLIMRCQPFVLYHALPLPSISFNNVFYFWYNSVTKCRLWLSWFGCIFDRLEPGIKFLFPSTNRAIKHISRSVNNRNLS